MLHTPAGVGSGSGADLAEGCPEYLRLLWGKPVRERARQEEVFRLPECQCTRRKL